MSSGPESVLPSTKPSPPGAEALIGTRVHKYEITRVLGQGGMGTVYEALNTAIGKRVAMKFIDAETVHNKDAVARFQREAQAASAVESAHIVEIFDSGYTEAGRPYIVMELLRGEDLGHRIKRCGRLELPEAVHIAAQILRGLHRAHAAGIVHRDLKPDNVFLVDRDDDSSFAKILDFGISKVQRDEQGAPVHTLTREGTVLGTPFYMSPEQAQALADIDGRTDLWSLGAILYECLTGRPPYTGTSYEQVIVNICMYDADDVRAHNPAVPEGIARLIGKALSRDRAARFASARELLDALKAVAGSMISSRAVLSSGGDSSPGASSGDFHSFTPRESGATPRPASSPVPSSGAEPLGMKPTLEVNQASLPKVGWSTSRRVAARRDRRTALVVALTALLTGGLGAFMFVRTRPARGLEDAAGAGASAESAVQIKTNVAAARVLVDGVEQPGGLLKGPKGDVKKVRIEAAGYTPSEIEVTLDAEQESMQVTLVPTPEPALVVAPAAEATGAVSVAMSDVKVRPGGKARLGGKAAEPTVAVVQKGSATAPPQTSPAATAAEVVPAAPPKPHKAPGVGGELKLKTD